ncbi:hypothetical protein [Holdemania sp. 1001302B_160321_E10]|uniref:hypothetical protein n=1 Tax=Holdemania sp. 1001302B_160321_E10 TaxID=2787120 RepID=UPI001896C55B|nr:hypothetical protein [Holdemania sp. 1001302B_160321_E10]
MSKKKDCCADQQEMQEFLEMLQPLNCMERALVKNSISTIHSLRVMEQARKPTKPSADPAQAR